MKVGLSSNLVLTWRLFTVMALTERRTKPGSGLPRLSKRNTPLVTPGRERTWARAADTGMTRRINAIVTPSGRTQDRDVVGRRPHCPANGNYSRLTSVPAPLSEPEVG